MRNLITLTLAACVLAACGNNSPIGTVDVQRVAANWSKYQDFQNQLSADEQQIANSKVSADRKLQLVVTREGVGYGGVDITPDVEKLLNITEKATPTP